MTYFFLGLFLGLIPFIVLLVRRSGSAGSLGALNERLTARDQQLASLESQLSTATARIHELTSQLQAESSARSSAETLAARIPALEAEITALRGDNIRFQTANSELQTSLEKDRQTAVEKIQLLTEAKEELSNQFKTLASEILEEKSKRFAEQNQENLGTLLDPLKTQLSDFKAKVEEVYVKEGEARAGLKTQVEMLANLNQKISEDAKNLTTALKGSNKVQGNYGELVLEKVLESSGLRKGQEYHVQVSHTRDDGSRVQPDVVINLPEGRRLVVDSKISLDAYQTGVTAEDAVTRDAAVKAHIASVQTHIKGLSIKNYQQLYGIDSLDFVIMFVPLEPAFMMALTHEKDLFMEAWNRNVLLVSPSTLLFVVRTVAHLWRQEAQTRNAQEIAERGAELYDKLAGFVKDFENLGGRLKQAQEEFDDARSKLSTGRGNVIRQAQMLRELGVKPTKELPAKMVELSKEELPSLPEAD
jgi:DNA recombination protein RmuC